MRDITAIEVAYLPGRRDADGGVGRITIAACCRRHSGRRCLIDLSGLFYRLLYWLLHLGWLGLRCPRVCGKLPLVGLVLVCELYLLIAWGFPCRLVELAA